MTVTEYLIDFRYLKLYEVVRAIRDLQDFSLYEAREVAGNFGCLLVQ